MKRIKVSLPDDLREQLAKLAAIEDRSLNGQIVHFLRLAVQTRHMQRLLGQSDPTKSNENGEAS